MTQQVDCFTVYLAGPMRGLPQLNWPAFELATILLRHKGLVVVSPVEMDVEAGMTCDDEITAAVRRQVISRDTQAIIHRCDGIALLVKCNPSKGCAVEVALGLFLDIPVLPVEWWLEAYIPGYNFDAYKSG